MAGRSANWLALPALTRAVCLLLEEHADSAGRVELYDTDVFAGAVRVLRVRQGEGASVRRHLEQLIAGGHARIDGTGIVADRRSSAAVRQARYRAARRALCDPSPRDALDRNGVRNAVTNAVTPDPSRGDARRYVGGRGGSSDLGLSSPDSSSAPALFQLLPVDDSSVSTGARDSTNGATETAQQLVAKKAIKSGGKGATKEKAHERYAAAYAAGISRASGAPYVIARPGAARADLVAMATGHARDAGGEALRGDALLAWFTETAAEYRTARAASAPYESGFGPGACLKWLNSGRPGSSTATSSRTTYRKGIQPRAEPGQEAWTPATGDEFWEDFEPEETACPTE